MQAPVVRGTFQTHIPYTPNPKHQMHTIKPQTPTLNPKRYPKTPNPKHRRCSRSARCYLGRSKCESSIAFPLDPRPEIRNPKPQHPTLNPAGAPTRCESCILHPEPERPNRKSAESPPLKGAAAVLDAVRQGADASVPARAPRRAPHRRRNQRKTLNQDSF